MSPANHPLILCIVLLLVAAMGCNRSSDELPPEKESPATSKPETPGVPPAQLAPRRDRAGLDLGARGDRPPAATLRPTRPPARIPALETGPAAARAQAAVRFVHERWFPEVTGEDEGAYRSLLRQDFVGMVPGEDKPIDATRWISIGAMSAHRPVTLGSLEVHPMPGPLGRTTVRFHERRSNGGCSVALREFTLQPGEENPSELGIAVLSLSAARPCTEAWDGLALEASSSPEKHARAAHDAFKAALSSGDEGEITRGLAARISVREHGREVATHDHGAMTGGAGRWVLTQLESAEVTRVTVVPPEVRISSPEGVTFVYRRTGGGWRLTGLDRGQFAAVQGSPKD